MKHLPSKSLSDEELDYLDNALLEYGNDDSILGISELDGFLTAVVSGPETIVPSRWLPAMWGGASKQPNWPSIAEAQRFMSLVMQHMNFIVYLLMEMPKEFQAILNVSNHSESEILIAEEWCFGYMRGVELGNWPTLPEKMDARLQAIRLHGTEEHFASLAGLGLAEHQRTVKDIEPAVRELHAYWLAKRSPSPMPAFDTAMATGPASKPATANLLHTMQKVGRNDPCPCGSGKKFKQCCLH